VHKLEKLQICPVLTPSLPPKTHSALPGRTLKWVCISGAPRSPEAKSLADQVGIFVPGRLLYFLIISIGGMDGWMDGREGGRRKEGRKETIGEGKEGKQG